MVKKQPEKKANKDRKPLGKRLKRGVFVVSALAALLWYSTQATAITIPFADKVMSAANWAMQVTKTNGNWLDVIKTAVIDVFNSIMGWVGNQFGPQIIATLHDIDPTIVEGLATAVELFKGANEWVPVTELIVCFLAYLFFLVNWWTIKLVIKLIPTIG